MTKKVPILLVDREADRIMRQDAVQAFPNECCGFFFGSGSEHDRFVTTARPVVNAKDGDQRRRFEISAADYMKAEAYALQHNITLLGVYHSHPQHPAIASGHDLRSALPFFSYIIYSVVDGKVAELRSWRLADSGTGFAEEEVTVAAENIGLKVSNDGDQADRPINI